MPDYPYQVKYWVSYAKKMKTFRDAWIKFHDNTQDFELKYDDLYGETLNGALTNISSGSKTLDFFVLSGTRNMADIIPLFQDAFHENKDLAIRSLLHLRDCRGGKGERETTQTLVKVLVEMDEKMAKKVMKKLPELGRWDDLLAFFGTALELDALRLIKKGLFDNKDGLCFKWMPRKGVHAKKLQAYFKMTEKEWRTLLSANSDTVEQKMCAQEWNKIYYPHVPSLAMNQYKGAFREKDKFNFERYLEEVKEGKAKINANVLVPHEICRKAEQAGADLLWANLPDYLADCKENFFPLIDVSSSMENAKVLDHAVALGLYIAERNKGVLKNKFLTFSTDPNIDTIKGKSLIEKITSIKGAEWGGSTNLEKAFVELLRYLKKEKTAKEDMPTTLIVFSDMEFNNPNASKYFKQKNIDVIRKQYQQSGFEMPKLIFWNLSGRVGNMPVKKNDQGVAMVSGFSPALMTTILKGEEFNPFNAMIAAIGIDKYKV